MTTEVCVAVHCWCSPATSCGTRRSSAALCPGTGFLGVVVFLGPLLALQKSVASDRPSLIALTPYTLWVIGYDVPWAYQLWRLNPRPSR